jgi:hypothetical protein
MKINGMTAMVVGNSLWKFATASITIVTEGLMSLFYESARHNVTAALKRVSTVDGVPVPHVSQFKKYATA